MNVENKLSLLKGKTVSKLLVVLFAALMCSVLVLVTADDSAAIPYEDTKYDIIFNFEIDGEPFKYEHELVYGAEIPAPGDLEKDSDNYFNYTFVGWELSPVDSGIFFTDGDTVTEDATYNAKYTQETRLFTVTFNFEIEGEIFKYEHELIYDAEIPAPGDLEKDSDTQFDYTFVGWELSPEGSETFFTDGDTVTGDATYNAKFSSEARIYTITFNFEIEGELATMSFDLGYGIEITTPGNLEKDSDNYFNYTFVGWELSPEGSETFFTDGDTVTGDATYNAKFSSEARIYTITFNFEIEGELVTMSFDLGYGIEITTPGNLEKDSDNYFNYTFVGWELSPEGSETFFTDGDTVTGDATYNVKFSSETILYTITFTNGEDVVTQTLEFDADIIAPADPTQASTDTLVYTFTGWEGYTEDAKVTGDQNFNSTFSSAARTYTITFTNGEDVVTQTLEFDADIIAPADPTQASTDTLVYTFTGWEGYTEDAKVTGDQNFNSTFSSAARTYTITFTNGEDVVTQTLEFDADIIAPADPTQASTDTLVYTFTGWEGYTEDAKVTGDQNFNSTFSSAARTYTITFTNGEDVVTQTLEFDADIIAPADPTQASTDTLVYTFTGWEGYTEDAKVTGDQNFNSTFSSAARTYTITFTNGEDVVTQTLEFDADIIAPADPTQASTDTLVYTFTGWEGYTEDAKVTGDQNFNSTFSSAARTYTITFTNGEDVVTQTLEFDADIIAPADPTQASTDTLVYTFTGWEGYTEDAKVTGDQNFNSTFSSAARTYTITFTNGEDVVTQTLEFDADIIAPADPTQASTDTLVYTFTGWEGYTEDAKVTGDQNFNSTFSSAARTYTITFTNGEDVVTQTLEFDADIIAPADPTQASTDTLVYTFTGWEGYTEDAKVTGDQNFNSTFSSAARTYTITFTNGEDVVTQTLEFDADIIAPADPTQASTDTLVYTFTGWEGYTEDAKVTGDQNFNSTFSSAARTYTITFTNGEDVVTQTLEFDADIIAPADPTQASTDTLVYTFTGWEGYTEDAKVTGDQNFNSTFSSAARTYTITFTNGEDVVTQTLEFDADIIAPADPTQASTDTLVYTFTGWEGYTEDAKVTGDQNFNSTFSSAARTYTITFTNGEDVVTQTLEFDADIIAPADPTQASTDTLVYTFTGWEGYTEDAKVTGDQNFNSTFSSAARTYTITFTNGEDVVTQTLEFDADIIAPADPTQASTDTLVYTFTGWEGYTEDAKVTGDQNFNSTFSSAARTYTITFTNGEDVVTQTLEFDADIIAPADPTQASTDTLVYTFTGWEGYTAGTKVTGDQNFNSTFSSAARTYTITFTNGEDVVTQTLEFDADIIAPADPTQASTDTLVYTFTGWEGYTATPVMKVTGDLNFNAKFSSVARTYTIEFMNGTTAFDTQTLAFDELIVKPTAVPEQDSSDTLVYTFEEWTGYTDGMKAGGSTPLSFVAAYTDVARTYTIEFMNGTTVFDTQDLEFDELIVKPTTVPEQDSSDTLVYTFEEWTGYTDGMKAGGSTPLSFVAAYTDVARTYTITFTNGEDVVTQTLEFDADIIAPADPTQASTDTLVYTFTGWEGYTAGTKVTGDQNFNSTFSSAARTYTITFTNGEDVVTQTLEFDADIIAPADPTQASTDTLVYTFTGWEGYTAGTKVTGDQNFNSTFSSAARTYTITWIVYGITPNKTEQLIFGVTPNYGTDPEKVVTDEFTFTFEGWDIEVVDVTGNVEYVAQFSHVTNEYTITWIVDGIATNKTDTLAYGATPNYGTDPEKTATAQYTFGFIGWDSVVVDVTGNAEYVAQFSETVNEYTITWVVDGLEYTTMVVYGDTPTYEATVVTDQYVYTIIKWNVEPVVVTGPATYTAEFTQTLRIHTDVPSTEVLNDLIKNSDNPVLQVSETVIDTIDNSVFKGLGEDKSLIINVMKGDNIAYSWTFNGEYKAKKGTIFNAGIETVSYEDLNEDFNKAIDSINIKDHLVLNFAASGELPINASVKYYVGDEYADGTELSLFFYNDKTKQLEDQSQASIVTEGFVTFELTHCSYYVLVDLSLSATVADNNTLLYVGIAIMIVVIISFIAVVVVRSKNRV